MQVKRDGRIRWLTGEYAGRICILPEGETFWIGSDGECDILLRGRDIAPYHLGITCGGERGGFYVLCFEPDSVFLEDGTPFPAEREQWIPSGTVLLLGDGSNRICPVRETEGAASGGQSGAGRRKVPDSDWQSPAGGEDGPDFGRNGKRPRHSARRRLALAAGILCVLALAGVGVWKAGLLNAVGGGNSSGNGGLTEGTISYSDGNTVYQASEEEIVFDHEACVLYYQNLLDVYLWEEISDAEKKQLAESVGGTVVGDVGGITNLLQIQVDAGDLDTLLQLADQLEESELVLYASYDYPVMLGDETVDTSAEEDQNPWNGETDKGNEENPGGNDWWAEAIGAYTAWEYADEADTTFVLAGELDSGFLPEHEEFLEEPFGSKLSFLADFPEHPVESINNNGEIEYNSHGTHVAGIIAANNNDKGIRGIADQTSIICTDWGVQDDQGNNRISQSVLTEIYAQMIEQGARAINNSWATIIYSQETYEREHREEYGNASWEEYYQYITSQRPEETARSCICILGQLIAYKENTEEFLIVASAGNGYDNNLSLPGCDVGVCGGYFTAITRERFYDQEFLSSENQEKWREKGVTYETLRDHLIIVSAVDKPENGESTYKLCSGAGFGSGVDIVAPGIDILSSVATSEDAYESWSGASMATPMVTGAATLLWSLHPDWSAAIIKEQLLSNAGTAYGTNAEDMGQAYKMLNIGAAVVNSADHGGVDEEETDSAETVSYAADALWYYLDTVLAPQYGVMDTELITGNYTNGGGDNWTSSDVKGLLSGNIMDFDGDGQDELLTVRFEPDEEDYPHTGRGEYLILEMYEYHADSDSVELSAGKQMETAGPCYGGNGIGYSQTGIFTYTYLGDTYIAVDSYHDANGYQQTFSVFQYGGSGVIFDVVVPHTGLMEKSDTKVQRDGTSFEYICGANFYLVSEGDYYVHAAYTEPENPLGYEFDDASWSTLMEYQAFYTPAGSNVAEANDPITEEQKADMIECYRQRIEEIGLYVDDPRIGMAENSGMPTDDSVSAHTTTPDVYMVQEGSITFLAGLYTYKPSTDAYNQITLERQDYEGTLDAYRN